MDNSETIAYEFLEKNGYKSIIFEPNGRQTFPDFLVDQHIGVEVRRLNKNIKTVDSIEGHESESLKLLKRMENLFQDLNYVNRDGSWFISYRFSRPMDNWSEIRRELKLFLKNFYNQDNKKEQKNIKLAGNFIIDITRSSLEDESVFLLAGVHDLDFGGWVLADLEFNINYCITEKTKKRKNSNCLYDEWHLLLVNYLCPISDSLDGLANKIKVEHDWDKVILLDPFRKREAIEI